MSEFEIREDDHGVGKVLILKSAWSPEVTSYLKEHSIYALRLSDSTGFKSEDLSFLTELTFLKSLEVYCWGAKGIKAIEHLSQLEVLGLQFKSAQKIDLSNFGKLRVAKVTWTKGLLSLFKCSSIECLNIQNYPNTDLSALSKMVNLRSLYLTSRKLESLKGIEGCNNLEVLDLYNCQKLVSLSGTELCPNLNKIEIEACSHVLA